MISLPGLGGPIRGAARLARRAFSIAALAGCVAIIVVACIL